MGFMHNARTSARKFGAAHNLNNYGILIGFILIVIVLSFANPHFLTYSNIINVLRQVACIGIATVAVGVLIIMNCIDLSIGSLFALCGITAGIMVSTGKEGLGLPAVVGYLVGILTGVVVGLFNGVTVAKGKIPAFIVTMGSMSIARGLALILAHGMPVGSFPDQFTFLGTASVDGGNLIPWSVIIFLCVILVMNFVMKKRPLGRYVFAIGSNEDAAIAAGINSQKIKIMAYLVEGGLVGLGATLLSSRLKSAAPALGQGYELDAIAGAIIGGVSFTGGIGSVWGMVLGAMIIGVINNGMDLLGVPAFYKQVVKGTIIIVAVLLDRRRAGRG
ncbi:MAG: ABC transporter permease [Rectinemataceae bacterium]|jgi:ribose/xylose/arabinose/galactoside ABC-type transport system permease subunit